MSARQRSVVWLIHGCGWSHGETAEALGITATAVSTHLARAVARLPEVLDVARSMARVMGREDIEAEVSGKYRVGDVRHCFADVRLARRVLGYEPAVAWEDGLAELAGWLEGQQAEDHVGHMRNELEKRGLAL